MQTEFTRNICESSGLCSIAGSKKDSTSGEVREEGSRRKIRRLKRKVEEERQGTRSVRFWRQCNPRKKSSRGRIQHFATYSTEVYGTKDISRIVRKAIQGYKRARRGKPTWSQDNNPFRRRR